MWKGGRLFGVMAALTFSSVALGCQTAPDVVLADSQSQNVLDCVPINNETLPFNAQVSIHESARSKVADAQALCAFTNEVGKIMGAQGPIKIEFISKGMSKTVFYTDIGQFMNYSEEQSNTIFDEIQLPDNQTTGAHTQIYGTSRGFVVVDTSSESWRSGVLSGLSTVLGLSNQNGTGAAACTNGAVGELPYTLGLVTGFEDGIGHVSRDISAPIVSVECNPGQWQNITLDAETYTSGFQQSYMLNDLFSKAFGIVANP